MGFDKYVFGIAQPDSRKWVQASGFGAISAITMFYLGTMFCYVVCMDLGSWHRLAGARDEELVALIPNVFKPALTFYV